MRHVIGRDDKIVSKLNVSSSKPDNPQSLDGDATPSGHSSFVEYEHGTFTAESLREILPAAKFFCDGELSFHSIASDVLTAKEGQLVAYRIGDCEPTKFIADALSRGVAGILTEQLLPCPLAQCIVGDVDLAIAKIDSAQFRHPDRQLLTIGVVGSAGKTTTALLISSLLRTSGIRSAFSTDLGDSDGLVQSTPDNAINKPSQLVQWLGEAVDANCQASIIEISESRARAGIYDAIQFDVLVVTGAKSKSTDFGPMSLQCALDRLADDGVVVASADDAPVIEAIEEHDARLITYGIHQQADVTAKIIEESGGMTTLAVAHASTTAVMESRLCGGAMAGNHAAAAAVGILLDHPLHQAVEVLGRLQDVPARQQRLASFQHADVVIDAGGDPQRVSETLQTMRRMKGAGRLWCVLAIDPSDSDERLADYGHCIERFADQSIVTCRDEGKSHFLRDSHAILDGVQKLASMRLSADHQRAVRWAIASAKPDDTVVIIGGITRSDAQHQRTEINSIVDWVESERKGQEPNDDDSEPRILSIFG